MVFQVFAFLCSSPANGQQVTLEVPINEVWQDRVPQASEQTLLSTGRTHTIHLLYDDSTLPDGARAKLISLLTQQPAADLKTITVTAADQGMTKLIQNNFHLSGITDKLSVDALAYSIRSLNHLESDKLVPGQTLRIPGLPSHVYRTNEQDKPAFRVSTIGAKGIIVASAPGDLVGNKELPRATQPRNGDLTAKHIADPQKLAELAWQSGPVPILPPGVFPLEDGGNIDIHLADSSPCRH